MENLLIHHINLLERGRRLEELLKLHKTLKKEQKEEYKKILASYSDNEARVKAISENTLYWILEKGIQEIIRYITTSYSHELLRFYLRRF